MKTKLLALALLAGGSAFAGTHFSIGVNIGTPGYYAPAPAAVIPPCPGPGYTWTDGYWSPQGAWIAGYWAPPIVNYYRPVPHYDRGHVESAWVHERAEHEHGRGNAFGHRR